MKTKHIGWIDGLKGYSCLLIFAHHFSLFFFPASYYGVEVAEHFANGIEVKFANSPLSFLINGNYLVCIFLILMSLVISLKWYKTPLNIKAVGIDICKKLPTLALPLFFVSLVAWVMMKSGLFCFDSNMIIAGTPWAEGRYTGDYSFLSVIKYSFFTVWTKGGSPFSTAFWMLNYIFLGSLLSYIFIIATSEMNWVGRIMVFLFVCNACILEADLTLYLCVPIGVYIGYLYKEERIANQRIIASILILLGVFLGGYPTGVEAYGAYKIVSALGAVGVHCIGGGITVIGVAMLNSIFFSNPVTDFLGKISYSVYLIHIPLLFSVSQYIFTFLYENSSYVNAAVVTFAITMVILILLAYAFTMVVIIPMKNTINKLVNKLYQ